MYFEYTVTLIMSYLLYCTYTQCHDFGTNRGALVFALYGIVTYSK